MGLRAALRFLAGLFVASCVGSLFLPALAVSGDEVRIAQVLLAVVVGVPVGLAFVRGRLETWPTVNVFFVAWILQLMLWLVTAFLAVTALGAFGVPREAVPSVVRRAWLLVLAVVGLTVSYRTQLDDDERLRNPSAQNS